MTATTNTISAAQSTVSAQKGSIFLLASVFALVRAALVIIASLSLGASARYFFPEMFAISNSPIALLAVVAVDTFAVAAIALIARAKSPSK